MSVLFKKPGSIKFLSDAEKEGIVNVIQEAEKKTSGEIRVFIEAKCSYVDPLDRAAEIFRNLGMEKTAHRNAVIIYIAYKDRQMAVLGDKGIHERVGTDFWDSTVKSVLQFFSNGKIYDGLINGITVLSDALAEQFPYHNEDKNELPDDIIFGN